MLGSEKGAAASTEATPLTGGVEEEKARNARRKWMIGGVLGSLLVLGLVVGVVSSGSPILQRYRAAGLQVLQAGLIAPGVSVYYKPESPTLADCATWEPRSPTRNTIWSFWDTEDIPADVGPILASWKLWAPEYRVIMLNPTSVRCFLPDANLEGAKELKLRTDIIRLRLLHKYGGVWMDSTVMLTRPLDVGPSGFVAIAIPEYQTHGPPADFVESWFLAADAGEYIVDRWAELLERVVSENDGVTDGISKTDIYTESTMAPMHAIQQHLPRGASEMDGAREWGEYLVVYATFTYLVNTDDYFRARVSNSSILDASQSGYLLQLKYEWNRTATRAVLGARLGAHPDHQRLIDGGIVKLSTSDREPIIQYFLQQPAPGPHDTPSFFAMCLKLVSNTHTIRRDQMQMVVAQYDEDTSWTDSYLGLRHIYTKGTPAAQAAPTPHDLYSTLPNLGRECNTYLTHVIDQYDSLPSYVAFTQGAIDMGQSWVRPNDWGPGMFPNMLQEAMDNGGCSNANRMESPLGRDWSWDFNLTRLASTTGRGWAESTARPSAHNFGQWFHGVVGFEEEPYGVMHMYPAGEFVVSRARIRSRPRIFYEQLRNRLDAIDPIECHFLERSWFYVFNCDKI